MGAPNASGLTRIALKLKDKFAAIAHDHAASDITSGTLPVERGGTGAATHTSNAVLTGNGTNAVNDVATASGALYATGVNGSPQFGTLPVAQGGTGADTAAGARTNLDAAQSGGATGTLALAETAIGNLGSSIATVEQTTATANHDAGDYFVLSNVLMRATSAIATGEQITASNAVPATLQSQIDTLRDSVSRNVPPIGSIIIALNGVVNPSTRWPGTTWVSCAIGLTAVNTEYAISQRTPGQQNSDVNIWLRNNSDGQKWWFDLYPSVGNRENATVWLRTA